MNKDPFIIDPVAEPDNLLPMPETFEVVDVTRKVRDVSGMKKWKQIFVLENFKIITCSAGLDHISLAKRLHIDLNETLLSGYENEHGISFRNSTGYDTGKLYESQVVELQRNIIKFLREDYPFETSEIKPDM